MAQYKNPDFLNMIRTHRLEPITWPEFKGWLAAVTDKEHRALLIFSYITGCRPIELKRLVQKDCNPFESRKAMGFMVGTAKKGATRNITIPVCNVETEELRDYVDINSLFPEAYVFPVLWKNSNISEKFKELNRSAKVGRTLEGTFWPAPAYLFRHSIFTLLSQRGATMEEICFYKGSPMGGGFGSVQYYIHSSSITSQKIAKIMKKIITQS